MYYFTNQLDSALCFFEASQPLVYKEASLKKTQEEGFNRYLTELATQFSAAIQEKKEIKVQNED